MGGGPRAQAPRPRPCVLATATHAGRTHKKAHTCVYISGKRQKSPLRCRGNPPRCCHQSFNWKRLLGSSARKHQQEIRNIRTQREPARGKDSPQETPGPQARLPACCLRPPTPGAQRGQASGPRSHGSSSCPAMTPKATLAVSRMLSLKSPGAGVWGEREGSSIRSQDPLKPPALCQPGGQAGADHQDTKWCPPPGCRWPCTAWPLHHRL